MKHQSSPGAILWRSWRLRCPRCGVGKLFRNWFTMHDRCGHCGLPLAREPGFYLGSIYVNYALTAILVTAGYFAAWFADVISPDTLLAFAAAFTFTFPVVFFRWARSLWLGFDHYFDPTDS